MDYSGLTTRLQGFSENDSLTSAVIDYLLDNAESRIFTEIEFTRVQQFSTSSMTIGDPFITLPAGCRVIKYLQITNTGQIQYLLHKDIGFINEYWPDRTATDVPLYFARLNENSLQVSPTPNFSFAMELSYTIRPAQMSSTNQSTWLGDEYPNLLFTAVMIELLKYQKGESTQIENSADKPSFWAIEYQNEVGRVRKEQMAEFTSDGYRGT